MNPIVVKSESALACRACLATNANLYRINEHHLIENFVQLTGTQVFEADGLPQYLCVFCRAMVVKFANFRNKTQTSQSLLVTILLEQQLITTDYLKIINRQSYNLQGPWQLESMKSIELIPTLDNTNEVICEVINAKGAEPKFVSIEIPKVCLINEGNDKSQLIPNTRSKVTANRTIIDVKEEENKEEEHEEITVYLESDTSDDFSNLDLEKPDTKVEIINVSKVEDIKVKNKSKKVNNKSKTVETKEKQENVKRTTRSKTIKDCSTNPKQEVKTKKQKNVKQAKSRAPKEHATKPKPEAKKEAKKKVIKKSNFETNELWFWFHNEQKKDNFEKEFNFKVNVLTKEQQIEAMQAKKLEKNYIESPFKCETCFRGYLNEDGYKYHMLLHTLKKDGDVVCEICGQRFIHNKYMIKHTLFHRVKLECNECGYTTPDKTRAMEHYRAHKGHKFECKHCGKKFRLKTNYYTHIHFVHPSELLPCDICGEGFCGEKGLRMHKKKHLLNDVEKEPPSLEHRCTTCGIQFPSSEAWNAHTQTDIESSCATLTKPCLDCGLNFADEESLQQHAETHKQLYPCDTCKMSFPSEATRNTHYQRKHLNVRRRHLDCEQVRQYYKKYRKRQGEQSRTIMCEVCGRKFACQAALLTHQRRHTGDLPFECNLCEKRFHAKINLKSHMMTHTGERPYQCKLCPKAFSKQVTLYIHQRVHTGVRPYTCSCGKSFKQSSSLKLHVTTVHLKQPAPYKSKKRLQRQQERLQGKTEEYHPNNPETVVCHDTVTSYNDVSASW